MKTAIIVVEEKFCLFCGKILTRKISEAGKIETLSDFRDRKFCGRRCFFNHNSGSNNHNWMGGIKHRKDGYLRNNHDKYIHRMVMEKFLGRRLNSDEHIHHLDGNPENNSIDNLELHTNSTHRKLEAATQKRGINGRFI